MTDRKKTSNSIDHQPETGLDMAEGQEKHTKGQDQHLKRQEAPAKRTRRQAKRTRKQHKHKIDAPPVDKIMTAGCDVDVVFYI